MTRMGQVDDGESTVSQRDIVFVIYVINLAGTCMAFERFDNG